MTGSHTKAPTVIQLAARARTGDYRALVTLMECKEPECITEIVGLLFPQGGLTPEMFDKISDAFTAWSLGARARS